tara:strand:- start:825 stop:1580 length:756 start_codon:yes stop_codon:yes gene_type:complete
LPVDDEINLDDPEGLTQNDIDRMSEQADELERIAYTSEKNAETIKKNFDLIGKMTDGKNFKQVGALTGESKDLNIDSMSGADMKEQMATIVEELLESKKQRKAINLDLEDGKQHRMRLDNELAKGFSKFNRELGVLDMATSNPIQFGKGKLLGFIGKAGAVGAIITMVVGLVQKMWEEYMQTFKAGGANDIRKLMEDRDKEMMEISDMIDRRSGKVFFSSTSSLSQGTVDISNTESLRDQVVRYQSFHLGE